MKKGLKIFLIIFAVIAVIAAVVLVRYREYVSVLIMSITSEQEDIISKQEDNNEKLVEKINGYLDEKLREPTDEEMAEVESGEMLLPELYSKILSERSEKIYNYNTEKKALEETPNESYAPSAEKSETDAVISKYMAQLYALQASYSAQAESMIAQGASYYNNLVKTQDRATARANTISHFTSAVRGLEAGCDAKVAEVTEKMKAELEALGADTSIIKTVKSTYENEKKLKMSYYANKYLK